MPLARVASGASSMILAFTSSIASSLNSCDSSASTQERHGQRQLLPTWPSWAGQQTNKARGAGPAFQLGLEVRLSVSRQRQGGGQQQQRQHAALPMACHRAVVQVAPQIRRYLLSTAHSCHPQPRDPLQRGWPIFRGWVATDFRLPKKRGIEVGL